MFEQFFQEYSFALFDDFWDNSIRKSDELINLRIEFAMSSGSSGSKYTPELPNISGIEDFLEQAIGNPEDIFSKRTIPNVSQLDAKTAKSYLL